MAKKKEEPLKVPAFYNYGFTEDEKKTLAQYLKANRKKFTALIRELCIEHIIKPNT